MSDVTAEMREEEPWRWCVYCDADCEVDEPEHATDCPSETGLYPVEQRDVPAGACEKCGHYNQVGMLCAECNCELKVGEFYALQSTDDDDIRVVVCVGCQILKPEAREVDNA